MVSLDNYSARITLFNHDETARHDGVKNNTDGLVEIDESRIDSDQGVHYGIKLTNNTSKKCSVNVIIDSIDMGTIVINKMSHSTLKRPISDEFPNMFRFDRVDSIHGRTVSAITGDVTNGTIVCIFTPERTQICSPVFVGGYIGMTMPSYRDGGRSGTTVRDGGLQTRGSGVLASPDVAKRKEGITTLGEKSSQTFHAVSFEGSDDPNDQVILNMRLCWSKLGDVVIPLRAL